jgi:glycogen debranching enzyme
MRSFCFAAALLSMLPLYGQTGTPELSRAARSWEFMDAVGQQASLLGSEDGTLEAYVYPLKLFQGLAFQFEVDGHVIPAEKIARRVDYRPGIASVIYAGDDFQIVERLIVPVHQPGGVIQLDVHAYTPIAITFHFKRDFQLMWPASFGSGYGNWDPAAKLYSFGADGQPYAAVVGSPNLELRSDTYATNYSSQADAEFSLGTINGQGSRIVAFAGSVKSKDDAIAEYRRLIADPAKLAKDTGSFYETYLARTISVELPDKHLQAAYDWSRLSLIKGMVDNPFLGKGLVAGYGPSKGAYRPGYAWFFGRDSFWSSFALNSDGDLNDSRAAIEFIAKFQRADGKIPHEISQSATLVPWEKDYPYEYASADSTPLFITAVRDYVQTSGDTAFANQMWSRLTKAMNFSRSTLDANGFPKNFGVGTGWVEAGPLLPVRVEMYMAGCYVEAVHSLTQLARWTGHKSEAIQLEQEFDDKRQKLNNLFWLPDARSYAFAIDNNGKPVNQTSVLAIVPEWWDLLETDKAQTMIGQLAEEDHDSDWGMRIISSKAPIYNPAGYHFGSVWPLFTGWASLAEYNAHEALQGWANLKANSWLSLDGANGNTTEVLSGQTYSPLSTASPHQTWSAAMIVSPLLRGVFGLTIDGVAHRVRLEPHLPASWNDAAVRGAPFGGGTLDFILHRDAQSLTLRVENHGANGFLLDFSPAYSLYTNVTDVSVNGEPVKFTRRQTAVDWHPEIETAILNTGSTIVLKHDRLFAIDIPAAALRLGDPSDNLKFISENWENNYKRVTYILSGVAGRTYEFGVTGAENVLAAVGAQAAGGKYRVTMPSGSGYIHQSVRFDLKADEIVAPDQGHNHGHKSSVNGRR